MDENLNYSWIDKDHLELSLQGDYLLYDNDALKEELFAQYLKSGLKRISVTAKNLKKWDSSLVIILFETIKTAKQKSISVDLSALPEGLQSLIDLAFKVDRKPTTSVKNKTTFLEKLGDSTISAYTSFNSGLDFILDALSSLGRLITRRAVMRPIDFQFALEDCSYKSFSIVALISFMVGLIFGFVGALQLKMFGAQIYVASLVAIAMVRVMGAVMTGIIIAGRTGSSYAATIGTMQVNEEIDALSTMGIRVVDFLLLPRMAALMIMMPLLTVFSDVIGILGGAAVGILMLDLAPQEYWETTLNALNISHFLVGLSHGFVFGCIIALCGCYYGIKCGRDADSVGKATTSAVVYSIVWIIVATAIITIFCEVFNI